MNDDKYLSAQAIELFDDIDLESTLDGSLELYTSVMGIDEAISPENLNRNAKTLKQLELALWASEQSVWMWSKATNIVELKFYLNKQYEIIERKTNFSELNENIHPDDADLFIQKWEEHLRGNVPELMCRFRYLQNADYRWIELRGKVSTFDDFGASSIIGTFLDITDIVDKQTALSLMSQAFSKSKQPMLILSQNMYIAEHNEAWTIQLDPYQETEGVISFADLVSITKSDMNALSNFGFFEKQTNLQIGSQASLPVEILVNQFESKDALSKYYIVVLKDLTEKIATDKELHRLATTDPVTGLLNRLELQNQVSLLIQNQVHIDLLYLEVSGIKEISDALGHENKDKILCNLAQALKTQVDNAKLIAMWGTSEFVLVLDKQDCEGLHQSIQTVKMIINHNSFMNNGQKFNVQANMGISQFPEHAKNASDLLRKADAALYYSKEDNTEFYSIYSKGMADEIKNKIVLMNDLREALEKEELAFVLQGKYDTQRMLIGAEILCRWNSDKHGFVSPGVFIPLIEKYGMEFQLGLLAVKNAISFIQVLGSLGIYVPISVNISATQILDDNFLNVLKKKIRVADINPKLLELEITESVFINDDNSAGDKLKALKKLGVRISLDDFGTGYSSLSYLGQYQFDVVKIDRSFIIEIEQNEKARKLFIAIMNVCVALDLEVVVEGIETEEQFSILQNAGVEKFQGFLLGKPIQISDFLVQNDLH